ncbi:ATP-grasp domain-containing protein [Streptomyces rapamycinicus]|uniref:Alpha-L-glutamate ligase n=2 Tax=Streptomyces rapamycinicus TaxID=1226757 RepID=A0A0A0N3U3_STRRN|nr:alpha-L-glutamate ligase [Streptomyces rapamycinicus]AGP52787.1 alpha-L-glutamate ligase [Streptomyces rapamycinicus NRRL 5491]MBB4780262.1 ribosomal protein S6--L-glutamate ligase [Streptomyces rapamycinicus]RLV75083.1 alpha-L-glutamate ligase [Streptomyces rapamycinicus NRRL 5491]UTO60998.1 alpha-L-glutamate ligase [Streptomyces rapamycinicus]UTP28942.1 alpha-L-glutamate ligase [Streptomyces rapamycinicus NRRL 5491]
MRIGLITADPGHQLLADATALLTPRHEVVALDPRDHDGTETRGPASAGELADVYLLKARTPPALALARSLERRGAPVVNSAAATARCQDRTEMADRALRAGLPFAPTRTVASLAGLAAEPPRRPAVVKSRHSRRHDLVARVDDAARLRALTADWADEPVVVQDFVPNDGWDHKLWVVAGRVFAALRRSELAAGGRGPNLPLALDALPPGWLDPVLRVGSVFSLDVYGVDLIDSGGGAPLIVDINAFPGIRGQAGAPEALAALALRTAERGGLTVSRT